MAGLHLQQLHAACLALEAPVNAALAGAGLDPLTSVQTEPPAPGATCPYLVVSLGGWRRRGAADAGPQTQDELLVSLRLETAGGEAAALAYEGVVATVVRAARASVSAAVTDATLTGWQLERGMAGVVAERTGGWSTVVKVRARLEW